MRDEARRPGREMDEKGFFDFFEERLADSGWVKGAGFVVAVLTRGEGVRSSDGCSKVVGAADG